MATSGVYTFTQNRNQIIKRALRQLNVIDAGKSPSAAIVADAADALNAMVKAWQASGIHIWSVEEATLFVQPGQADYDLGLTATDHATSSYVATTLSAAEASGQTVLSITSASGMASGDNIGIVLDGGTIHWSTISGSPGATATIAGALTGNAASGNAVYAYTSKIVRPLRIPAARRYTFSDGQEIDLGKPLARLDYRAMPNKTTRGAVNQFYYDPRGGATVLGRMSLWTAPANVLDAIKFTYHRPLQDFSASTDTPDLPQEWVNALTFNLAVDLATEFSVPADKYATVKQRAEEYLALATGYDRESESILFTADERC